MYFYKMDKLAKKSLRIHSKRFIQVASQSPYKNLRRTGRQINPLQLHRFKKPIADDPSDAISELRLTQFITNFFRFFFSPTFALFKICKMKSGIVQEVKHYTKGSKILLQNICTSLELVSDSIWKGDDPKLRRAEQDKIVRTFKDIFRFIPMMIIVITPLLEFTLPFLVKVMPGIMPSTFAHDDSVGGLSKLLEKKRKQLKETQKVIHSPKSHTSKENIEILQRLRKGLKVPQDDLIRVAVLIEDEIFLDSLQIPKIRKICKFLGIRSTGLLNALRNHLETHLDELKNDDLKLSLSNLWQLENDELNQECRERGMAATKMTRPQKIKHLSRWLDLSLAKRIPLAVLSLAGSSCGEVPSIAVVAKTVMETKEIVFKEILVHEGVNDPQMERDVANNRARIVSEEQKERKILEKEITQAEKESLELHEISENLGTLMGEDTIPLEKDELEKLAAKCREMEGPKIDVTNGRAIRRSMIHNLGGVPDSEQDESKESLLKDVLTYPEATHLLVKWMGIEKEYAAEIVAKLDVEKDGTIDLKELRQINMDTEKKN